MTEKEIIKKLSKMYIRTMERFKKNHADEMRLDLLDDIFEEIFDIRDISVGDGYLISEGKRIS